MEWMKAANLHELPAQKFPFHIRSLVAICRLFIRLCSLATFIFDKNRRISAENLIFCFHMLWIMHIFAQSRQMLIKFIFDNVFSFRDKTEITLEAGFVREHKATNVLEFPESRLDIKVVKSLGIYGYNASGKSNILKAFSFMQGFVLSSIENKVTNDIPISQFKLGAILNPESSFEVTFMANDIRYRYGFKITKKEITQEWLYHTVKRKEEFLFVRLPSESEIRLDKKFKDEANKKVELVAKLVPPRSLFLTQLGQYDSPTANVILKWFSNCLIIQDSYIEDLIDLTAKRIKEDSSFKLKVYQLLEKADIGFSSVESDALEITKKTDQYNGFLRLLDESDLSRYDIKTKHSIYDNEGKLNKVEYFKLRQEESSGSQKFFALLSPIVIALQEKRLIMIDEIDSRFHNNLLVFITNIFNSVKENPGGAQLVYVSHNAAPLSARTRRDQVLLVTKDKGGISSITRLNDDKKIRTRHDASMEKQFKEGDMVDFPKPDTE